MVVYITGIHQQEQEHVQPRQPYPMHLHKVYLPLFQAQTDMWYALEQKLL